VAGFGYDGNSNLTSLTPPGRPAHAMAYTPVNLLERYTAPSVGPPTVTPDIGRWLLKDPVRFHSGPGTRPWYAR
jgi:hypothetical protein